MLKPTLVLTAIMSVNGVLQLFDESVNLTNGGPGNATLSMSHYIYNVSFKYVPNFGYAAAMSFLIMILVAVMAFVQMKVGDKRKKKKKICTIYRFDYSFCNQRVPLFIHGCISYEQEY